MIEMEIPRDIRKYESKLVGPFTTRQTVCLVLSSVVAFVSYKLTGQLPTDFRLALLVIPCIPILLFGWLKPYGMKLEQFLSTVFVSNVLSPKHRLYKINNIYSDRLISNLSPAVQRKNAKKARKKHAKSKSFTAYD